MKRKVKYYIDSLMLVDRNREWLKSGVEWKYKLLYYPSLAKSYVLLIIKDKHIVNYLGHSFEFDNPATPLNLQNYPYEITDKILANMKTAPKNILDIGGNVGQFSVSMKHVLGETAEVDIFEPNKEIFSILKNNISDLKNVKAFNYALGEKDQTVKMFFEVNRSATGSMVKENASDKQDELNEIDVKMVSSIIPLTKQKEYDLVKIDVEGYEIHVLKALKDIRMKYLFIEVSSNRSKDYLHSELFDVISAQFGQFDIVHSTKVSKQASTYDILLEFITPVNIIKT